MKAKRQEWSADDEEKFEETTARLDDKTTSLFLLSRDTDGAREDGASVGSVAEERSWWMWAVSPSTMMEAALLYGNCTW